jgi:predicted O-methyltransferase YrrM
MDLTQINMEGQINPESSFGKAIIDIASDTTYKTFLDVGTWNGMGTTRCLVNALKGRDDTMIYSVEANRDMFNKATKNWENGPSNLKLLYGKICKDMMSYEEIT